MPKKNTKAEDTPEKTFSLISNEKLLAIYSTMLKCRLLQQRATALFQHGKLASDLHVSEGLEATATAVVVDLQQPDLLCLAPNDLLPALAKGMSLETIFRALAPSSLHLDGPIQIEAEHKNILLASAKADIQNLVLNRASAASSAKNGAVAAVVIGVGSFAQWKQTIHAAGAKKLPVIFVHVTNLAEAPSSSSSAKPEALVHGVPSIAVDARDAVAVYRVAYEAIVRARQLRGATLLECFIDSQPPRPDDAGNATVDPITIDPVATMETYLKSKKIEPDGGHAEAIAAFNRDLDLATRFLDE